MEPVTPPIRIWFLVILTGVLFLAAVQLFTMSPYGLESEVNELVRKHLLTIRPEKQGETSVFILGSSVTRDGFGESTDLEKELSSATHKKIRLIFYGISSMSLKSIVSTGIMDYLTRNPPDYLFMESDLLYLQENQNNAWWYKYNLIYLKQILTRKIKDKSKVVILSYYTGDGLSPDYYTRKSDTAQYKIYIKKHPRIINPDSNKAITRGFSKLYSEKTRIIFLDYPKSSRITSRNMAVSGAYQHALQLFSQRYHTLNWKCPGNIAADSLFSDGAHLNSAGSRLYRDWFLKKAKTL